MAEVKDNTFIRIIEENFRFLETDHGFHFTAINAIMTAFDSEILRIRINYCERSGYLHFLMEKKGAEEDFIELPDLANAFAGELAEYSRGLAAFNLDILQRCVAKLSSGIRNEVSTLLDGDEGAWYLASEAKQKADVELLEMMQFGGIRNMAQDAWNYKEFEKFLDCMARIPSNILTESEKRRIKIARIKMRDQH